ncbi:MAG: HaeII family restriction endonuclease [Bacteroidota bacterium]
MKENSNLNICEESILKMLRKSQTKVIFPIIAYALISEYNNSGKYFFTDREIRKLYNDSVRAIKIFLKHNLHIGGKYYDAYPVRNLPKYGVLKVNENGFELQKEFIENSKHLEKWIPEQIKLFIDNKIGIIPLLVEPDYRLKLASDTSAFTQFLSKNISLNPSNFEVFSFSIIKVHLEKFACKIYRDTRTSAHDQGVDISTNFGVVYQIKKLKLFNKKAADEVYSEIKLNFDDERMNDGKVIIIIDDISKDIRNYLINMKVQSISMEEIIRLSNQFEDIEDRMKVLRNIYDEFRREYESQVN